MYSGKVQTRGNGGLLQTDSVGSLILLTCCVKHTQVFVRHTMCSQAKVPDLAAAWLTRDHASKGLGCQQGGWLAWIVQQPDQWLDGSMLSKGSGILQIALSQLPAKKVAAKMAGWTQIQRMWDDQTEVSASRQSRSTSYLISSTVSCWAEDSSVLSLSTSCLTTCSSAMKGS